MVDTTSFCIIFLLGVLMIKRYNVTPNSRFNNSIIIPFFEPGNYGFVIEGLDDNNRKVLFNPKQLNIVGKNKDIDVSKATYVEVVYLDDEYNLKGIVLYCPINKKHYFFRVEGNDQLKLKTQDNYISSNIDELLSDYEKRRSRKGDYGGVGDFNLIKDVDFFESHYGRLIEKQIDKNADITRLIFTKNNEFTSDFIRLIERDEIVIVNKERLNPSILTRDTMSKVELRNNRRDCLLVNFAAGDIEYFIFTSRGKNSLVNHYYLFKKINKNSFEFILEDIIFNKVFSYHEIKKIKFKDAGLLISKELSKTNYDKFYLKCLEFEKDEEIDESLDNEWKIVETLEQVIEVKEEGLPLKVISILKKYDYVLKDKLLYFPAYEDFPLASLGDGYIKIKKNRYLNDVTLTNQISLKDSRKIESTLQELLEHQPSSRLLSYEKIVSRLIKVDFDNTNEDQLLLMDEIDSLYELMRDTDKSYPNKYLENIYLAYLHWRKIEQPRVEVLVPPERPKEQPKVSETDVYITEHARLRMNERIGEMTDEAQLKLAREAYINGEHSGHYVERDPEMFMFLQYIQNKHPGKTLRLYKGIIYIFSLRPPHGLVTVYPFDSSFEKYRKNRRI